MSDSRFEAKTEAKSDPIKTSPRLSDLICQLAKKKDEVGLDRLLNTDSDINTFAEIDAAVALLSKEPHSDNGYLDAPWLVPIHFLYDFKAKQDKAVQNAARNQQLEQMERMLKKGAPLDYAVMGAAQGHHIDLMNSLLRRGAKPYNAMLGAGYGGHDDIVDLLIPLGEKLRPAVKGAVRERQYILLGKLLAREPANNTLWFDAVIALRDMNETTMLRLLASLPNPDLRTRFVENMLLRKRDIITFDVSLLVPHANTVANLCETKKIDIDQALAQLAIEPSASSPHGFFHHRKLPYIPVEEYHAIPAARVGFR